MTHTIFAPASGPGGGVAVVRVSGPAAARTLETLSHKPLPAPRVAVLRRLSRGGVALDRALCLYFKAPASFTGEDVVEYHLHGGRAVVEAVLAALGAMEGCRMAEPGEFTRRAFENGKLDLTEAEAVADLVAAETEAQRAQAFAQMEGALSSLYGGWAARLRDILARMEADIEFPDEDLPADTGAAQRPEVEEVLSGIAAHLDDGRRGERLRTGLRIAIIGAPNAGKSSLLNALARRDAAIVSAQAGTTRDVIEVHMDLGGYPVILADTAGLRDTVDEVESEGIRRAARAAGEADLKIAVFDGTREEDAATRAHVDDRTVVVHTKADLAARGGLNVSAVTGAGMDALVQTLSERAAALLRARPVPALTRARHRAALEEARAALARSLGAALPELAAEDVRLALRALGRITGYVHVEEVLDAVFRDFCIGK